ncbi:MAG: agmatine deiminase family protein, partial [Myxococcales bacterium]|nr:agmatine deiminase family protein [Myxococcales bacterium]
MADDHRFRYPAEWEAHDSCWLAWPSHEDLWRDALPAAQQEWLQLARGIALAG